MNWFSWFKRKGSKPTPDSPTRCPKCGREMIFVEKFTMTGSDIRTYRCNHCGEEHDVDYGVALWKAISDANKSD